VKANSFRKLSELEGVCLGIVRRNQSCTAYRVRRELKQAPSSHWQASAGSVYPLLARLAEEGLVESMAGKVGERGRKLLKITEQGRRSLRKWVSTPMDHDLISSVTDPIRSRMFFLDVLNAKQRSGLVDTLIEQMETYLVETEDHLEKITAAEDLYGRLAAVGAVKITAARLEWLRVVREKLGD
jgi:DNA-binding PadR family transcriptional regulator